MFPPMANGGKRSSGGARTQAEANRLAWARRHPERAADERRLRLERVATLKRWDHKREGTPETHEGFARREGALARLHRTGAIDDDQLAWAAEIGAIFAMIGRDANVRTASLETRIDAGRRGDGAFYEALGAVRREMAYSCWRTELGSAAAPVLAIVGFGMGMREVERTFRMDRRRALKLLIGALDAWPRCKGAARRHVDQADLDRAHARIA